jgi:hypothetical protein
LPRRRRDQPTRCLATPRKYGRLEINAERPTKKAVVPEPEQKVERVPAERLAIPRGELAAVPPGQPELAATEPERVAGQLERLP